MSDLFRFSHGLARLLPVTGSARFASALVSLLRDLAPVDEATVIVYKNAGLPVIDFALPDSWQQPNLDTFLKGAFLLDPYYLAATRQDKSGFFRLRDLAPGGFRKSEYYRIYYGGSGLQDECGYLVRLGSGGFINIALGLTRKKAFARSHLASFADIAPVIDTTCRRHYDANAPSRDVDVDLRQSLEAALGSFGSSRLTNREGEVIHLVLLGHTTKSVAEALNISYETVKLHRKHAYKKLGVSSQAELFHMFIDSLMNAEYYDGGDPLSAYPSAAERPAHG